MMTTGRTLNIGWKVSTLSTNMASVRYRALFPVLALEEQGFHGRVFSSANPLNLEGIDVLIIVKSFTPDDFVLALEAIARNIPVIVDLCDNIFVDGYMGSASDARPADIFLAIASNADAVVTTTTPLSEVIRKQLALDIPMHVIADGIESSELISRGERQLVAARRRELINMIRLATTHPAKLLSVVSRSRDRYVKWLRWLFDRCVILSRRRIRRGVKWLRSLAIRCARFSHRLIKRCIEYCHWRFWAWKGYRCHETLRDWRDQPAIQDPEPPVCAVPQSNPRFVRPPIQDAAFSVQVPALTTKYHDHDPFSAKRRRILWFGNHGAPHARFGMLDLLDIQAAIERIAAEFLVELVVVSNNLDKYREHILPLAIPSRYVKWSLESMVEELRAADVVVIPNSCDPFSLCKSANRTVLALSHGIPVVATHTPALEPLRCCTEVDDFYTGLHRYFTNAEHVRDHVDRGQKLIVELYGQSAIGSAWCAVLQEVVENAKRPTAKRDVDLIVALNLIQDLDLALPILRAAMRDGLALEVWCSLSLLVRSPRVKAALQSLGIVWRALPDRLDRLDLSNFFRDSKALLTVTETNLGPHRFTRRLTEFARRKGIATSTLQHGFENVGLTYSDDLHPIRKVNFASDHIYLWGPLQTLHPDVPQKTVRRCLPIGCPKLANPEPADLSALLPPGSIVVGIFENLHWHRYSDDYRAFFLDGVHWLVKAFPQITFLLKPHHAGLWLTSRYDGEAVDAPNLILVDPKDPQWEAYTSDQILGSLHAVITSPSTVALDAARYGLPTAVVAHTLKLSNYEPLSMIKVEADWLSFVDASVTQPATRRALADTGRRFANHVLLPGDGAEAIVLDLMQLIHRREAAA